MESDIMSKIGERLYYYTRPDNNHTPANHVGTHKMTIWHQWWERGDGFTSARPQDQSEDSTFAWAQGLVSGKMMSKQLKGDDDRLLRLLDRQRSQITATFDVGYPRVYYISQGPDCRIQRATLEGKCNTSLV